jgi:2'-hydroxyisoflavone reductase
MFNPSWNRRRLLGLGGGAAAALVAEPAWTRLFAPPRRLDLLVLGGTSFVGPHLVSEALARGHRVTLFNRGITHPELFPTLERLRGDRLADDGLAALAGGRRWDAVIDTWQGSPVAVAESAALMAGRVAHYAYVSTIAVYGGANYRQPGYSERSPIPDPGPLPRDRSASLDYPRRKRLGELAVQQAFPTASSLHRAHGIVGTDAAGRLDHPEIGIAGKAWWPVRLAVGGEVLAPGEPTDTTQYTDVVDLARFVVGCVEERQSGAFNVCETATLRDFFAALIAEARADVQLTWVPAAFLFERGLESFTDVPFWVSHGELEGAFYQASTERARVAGWRPRPIADTFGDVRRAFFLHHRGFDFGDPEHGIELARREGEVLRAWHAADGDTARSEQEIQGRPRSTSR